MLSFLPAPLRGAIAFALLAINTVFWCALLLLAALVKRVLPASRARRALDRLLNELAACWISCNDGWMRLTQRTTWDVQGDADLDDAGWYLVNCNHQSWVDILVLQHVLNRRIPMLKFFLKHQLIYVPIIGLAWWALDFPFMRRHSKAALRRHPELRDQDRESTRLACERFAQIPTSVMNFAEGTRLSRRKQVAQGSPYRHLLKPRAGALALSLNAMGTKFRSLLDVTVVYPAGAPTFWQFLCGRVPRVTMRLSQRPIPVEFCAGNYAEDSAFRVEFQAWLTALWRDKDDLIDALLGEPARDPVAAAATVPGQRALR